tara:strand:+ start:315 stop:2381 length:2067 start_codon:yes stop_codon:yes gene_type:complete
MTELIDFSKMTVIKEDPNIYTFDSYLSDYHCDYLINLSKNNLKNALVSGDKKGYVSQGRTGKNCWIPHNHDNITKIICDSISKLINVPIENAEAIQIIYYGKDQEYKQHYDGWLFDKSEKSYRNMKFGGQRIWTVLGYLNDVPKGGGTKFTKLDIEVSAKKGKLLIFSNVIKNSNIRHNLSEHCGMPVIEGEKYAFNLWFREHTRKIPYIKFNPEYYKTNSDIDAKNDAYDSELINFSGKLQKLSKLKDVYIASNFLTNNVDSIISKANFRDSKRRDAWINLNNINDIITNVEKLTNLNRLFFENANIIEYKPNELHGSHLEAYDLSSDKGKQYTKDIGQRIFSVTLILSENIEINFSSIDVNKIFSKGDLIFVKNTINKSINRDKSLCRSIINKGTENGYVINIYVREFNKNKLRLPILEKINNDNKDDFQNLENVNNENYTDTYNEVLSLFEKKKITQFWKGYKSFKYNFKGNFNKFNEYILAYKKVRDGSPNKHCLNTDNLEKEYNLKDDFFLTTVNNVLVKDALKILQDFYRNTINENVYLLGDKQSKRYKAHNEPMSRFLHYEILPLIEILTKKKLLPSYTYLSAYIKDSDLPGHTDREDCEYTVSFIVDKPEGSNWPIYVHKKRQPIKHKGRYPENPPIDECVPVDCDAGGLMIFQGTDRIHFREKLEYDYYNILLLHFKSV